MMDPYRRWFICRDDCFDIDEDTKKQRTSFLLSNGFTLTQFHRLKWLSGQIDASLAAIRAAECIRKKL